MALNWRDHRLRWSYRAKRLTGEDTGRLLRESLSGITVNIGDVPPAYNAMRQCYSVADPPVDLASTFKSSSV